MFNLIQKEDKFYTMLSRIASVATNAAKILKEDIHSLELKQERAKEITALEHEADNHVKELIGELNKAFMTPIDREDIFLIVKMLDNVIDNIDSVAHGFIMYNVTSVTDEAKEVSDMLFQATSELEQLILELRLIERNNKIAEKIANIKEIEHNADIIYRKSITSIFTEKDDVLEIIKWKEIYKMLEDTVDSCQKVSSIIEGVVMKHA